MIESQEPVALERDVFASSSPEMASLIAAKDWSKTPIGEPETWPPALRTILDVSLANRFPVVFWWGPQYVQFYNDQYWPILGAKHPQSLGQSGRECWAEIWPVIGPQIDSVFAGGPSTWNEDLFLEMNRHGFLEETYFTFSYSALPDPRAPGGIGGVLGTVQETTEKVVGERRMRLLRDLAARGTEAKTVKDECSVAVQTLERDPGTVPFARIYLIDETRDAAVLAAGGTDTEGLDWPESIALDGAGRWPFRSSGGAGAVHLHEGMAVAAIPSNVSNEITGYLVAGVNQRLRFDERYADFYRLVASQIGAAIASARAYEEERRRAEALAEIDRAKNVFFSNVSHEFRTPLTLMLGPLGELSKQVDDASKPLVDAAQRNSLRLLKLVNTLLEFSRLEAGRAEPSFALTDLAALTEEICSVFRSAIESAGLEFDVDIRLAERVYVDRAMWEKIVLNLLSNALKFTLEGRIEVSLLRKGDTAELRVKDTGAGIPEHELPHLFERFRRVRGTKSRTHEGSGIGLALVKDLVELHGGSVDVQSEYAKGSVFGVRVPFGSAHLDAKSIVTDAAALPHESGIIAQYLADLESTVTRSSVVTQLPASEAGSGRAKVLLADDNGDLREYVSRLLLPHYDVVAVRNGLEALAAAHAARFDLIISDVMMPEMDGFQLLAAVRAESSLSTTPFILLSARAGEENTVHGIDRGADDYISKPFSAEELLARVRANLNAASIREEAWQISEDRFRNFADGLGIMVWQHDPSGAVTFTNAEWHRITHLPRDPSSHTPGSWSRVVHPADYKRILGIIGNAIEKRSSYSFEYRVKPADAGEDAYRWYIATAEPQYAGDVFRGWAGYTIDIHDARVREDVERDFHALAEAVPVIVWTADASGAVDWYNNRWYDYTGQTREQAAGWGWQAAHHPDELSRTMQKWTHSIATGERFEMEFRLRRWDGVFRTFLTRIRPLRDENGDIVRWYGSNVDIQAQKETLDHSKRIAETLQGVFLPDSLPHTKNVRFDAVYVAAERDALVGGDWFDAAQLPDGRFLVSIGDVIGHGLAASVIAGALRQAILAFALTDDDPATILNRANRILRFQNPDKYATALVGLIDRDCTTLTYASAGHPPPLLAVSNSEPAGALPHGGLPLGIDDEILASSREVALPRESVLTFYTDGLVEFSRDALSAEEELKCIVAQIAGDTSIARPAVLVQKALLGDHPPVDDVAVLIAQFSEIGADLIEREPGNLVKEWRFHSSNAYTARTSRHELIKFIRRYALDPDAVFAVELILGEILANTVEHAPGLVEIRIDWSAEKPVITVRDTGPGLSHLFFDLPEDALDENGRGLFLIRKLAERVSVKPATGFGTELAATLPVTREI